MSLLSYYCFLHFQFTLQLYSVFPEYIVDRLSAFEGFIKICIFKKIAVWKLGSSERRLKCTCEKFDILY